MPVVIQYALLMDALVVGESTQILLPVPYMLYRAGFSVDLITTSWLLRCSRFARAVCKPGTFDEMVQTAYDRICGRAKPYDWVIPGDDKTLKALGALDWPAWARPRFLPADGERCDSHLFSKIGLSKLLSAGGIQTPAFRLAASCGDAVTAANLLGYPVFLKVDASSGGVGVHKCECDGDVRQHESLFAKERALVQKEIRGRELDLSAIYVESRLVHFAYSRVERALEHFGPSVLRTYYPLPLVDEQVFTELAALGRVLGADGFVTITCCEAEDGSGRYYFEADMRPNVWIDYPTYFGDDPAERIRKWFRSRECLTKESAGTRAVQAPITIPYFLRIQLWELIVNRYQAWKFIPFAEPVIVCYFLLFKCASGLAKLFLPKKIRRGILTRLIGARIKFVFL